MEILLNVIGYAGFIGIAKYHKPSDETETETDRWAVAHSALVRPVRFAGGAHQPVGLDQYMPAIRLCPERKADDDEGQAKQHADHHHAAVGRLIGIVKWRDHGCFPRAHPYADREHAQRELGFNLTE
jgi:hypothetical protein